MRNKCIIAYFCKSGCIKSKSPSKKEVLKEVLK